MSKDILLQDLLDRYLTGELTEEERLRFVQLLEEPGMQRKLNELLHGSFIAETYNLRLDSTQIARFIDPLKKKIQDSEMPVQKRIVFINSSSFKWAAAAAIFIIAVSAAYLLLFSKSKPAPQITATQPVKINAGEIKPGGNKAILVMSNGGQIILDSAANGVLSKQNGVQVTKLSDGSIGYSGSAISVTETYNTLSTPKGGTYQIVLQDGTKIWLNTSSSIRYPVAFAKNERKIELTGEAYFEVAHNAQQPFRIKAADQLIEDAGTAFNVKAYASDKTLRTTLEQGSVKIANNKNSITIKPGWQAFENKDGVLIDSTVTVDEVVAWKNGFFSFRNNSIYDVMEEFARWYDIEVSYEGKIKKQEFTGKLDRNINLESALKILGETKVHYRVVSAKKIIIIP